MVLNKQYEFVYEQIDGIYGNSLELVLDIVYILILNEISNEIPTIWIIPFILCLPWTWLYFWFIMKSHDRVVTVLTSWVFFHTADGWINYWVGLISFNHNLALQQNLWTSRCTLLSWKHHVWCVETATKKRVVFN